VAAVGDELDGATARRWVDLATAALERERERIDALNVYPVPDGDTGTNLHLTLQQAQADARVLPEGAGLSEVCEAMARGALMGARGNSGIIASQLLRGCTRGFAGRARAGAAELVTALRRGNDEAWAAVERPVEGTMLSVTQAAALAAEGSSVSDVLQASCSAAREALQRTTHQLPELEAANVVDAGGAGVVVLLEALLAAVTGKDVREEERIAQRGSAAEAARESCDHLPLDGPEFEVMYLLEAPEDRVVALRGELAPLGTSLVVVGGDGLWHVHVHVDDAGAAVEAAVRAGRPSRIRITHFAGTGAPRASGVGVVAWAAGPGLAELFRASGVVPVTPPGGHRASTGEVLDAVRRTGKRSVVVLPNDPDTLSVARAAASSAREEGLRVTVVPTRAQVQGLAAAAVHDPAGELDQDVAAMSAAAGATRHGAVTIAAREAITMAGRCSPGDVLGVLDGDFAVIGNDVVAVAQEVVTRLLSGGGEMVTLVTGDEAPEGLAAHVSAAVRRVHPEVEVTVVDGGQPRYPLLVGVE
jgi:uncharacterized protein